MNENIQCCLLGYKQDFYLYLAIRPHTTYEHICKVRTLKWSIVFFSTTAIKVCLWMFTPKWCYLWCIWWNTYQEWFSTFKIFTLKLNFKILKKYWKNLFDGFSSTPWSTTVSNVVALALSITEWKSIQTASQTLCFMNIDLQAF